MFLSVRQRRRGMTLMEILVTMAIIVGIFGIAMPSLRSIFGLERAQAAKQLATTYNYLNSSLSKVKTATSVPTKCTS